MSVVVNIFFFNKTKDFIKVNIYFHEMKLQDKNVEKSKGRYGIAN